MALNSVVMKTCSTCLTEKPVAAFYAKKCGEKTSYGSNCKICIKNIRLDRIHLWNASPTENVLPSEKMCSSCRFVKEQSEFGRRPESHDGLDSQCVVCRRNTAQKSKNTLKETNPKLAKAREMYHSAKKRAEAEAVAFDLDVEWVLSNMPDECPALKIPLNYASRKSAKDNSPSLDRIVPELGYTKTNTCVISYLANTIKNAATPLTVRSVAQWMSMVNDLAVLTLEKAPTYESL